ncbi:unnamed protein product [Mytilus edulis]|uniref:C1q domain-containing protein n=1 Tax=Mytilus edulis TaxID=6550 RepID=A0A8S3SX34_MYTED|nr:unnamed protein product [Mytilus edulis]
MRTRYRLGRDSVAYVCNIVGDKLRRCTTKETALAVEQQVDLCRALRFYASGELCCKQTPSDSSTIVNQQISIISNKLDKIQRKTETLTQQTKLVAFTACLSAYAEGVQKGQTIKLGDIKSSFGVGSLKELNSSGRFTTRDSGLYQVIAIVNSHTNAAAFTINKNNAAIMSGFVAEHFDRGRVFTSIIPV